MATKTIHPPATKRPSKLIADTLLHEVLEAQADAAFKREAADVAASAAETAELAANRAGKRVAQVECEAERQGVVFRRDANGRVTGLETPEGGWNWA